MSPDTGVVRPISEVAAELAAREVRPTRWQRRAHQRAQAAAAEREMRERLARHETRLAALPLGTQVETGEVLVSAEVAKVMDAGRAAMKRTADRREKRAKAHRAAANRSRAKNRR